MIALVGLEKARDAPSVFTRSGVMMSEGVITTMLYQNRLLSVSVGGPLEDEKKDPHKDVYTMHNVWTRKHIYILLEFF